MHALRFGGFLGVELFFVLSGFLIGTIIIESVARSPTALGWVPGFWARRWMRTLPNYYLFLLVNAALLLFGVTSARPDTYLPYVFFVQNLLWAHPPFFPEAWSLAVEEVFYFFTPLLVGLAVMTFRRTDKAILISLLAIFTTSIAARWYEVVSFNPAWDEDLRKVTLFRLDGIMLGFLFAWLLLDAKRRQALRSVKLVGWLCAPLLPVCIAFALQPIAWLDRSDFARVALFPLTSLGCVGLLALGLAWQPPLLVTRVGVALARWSYSAYLANLPVFFLIMHALGPTPGGDRAGAAMRWLIFVTATLLIAALAYRVVERPCLALRDRLFPDGKLLLH